ncbi:MAG: sensor histidine kinase, partial [Myxococcaceae bacterium]
MRLYQQLVLFMLAATVLPLALLGFYLLRASEEELATRIGAEQRARATAVATQSAAAILDPVDAVTRATDTIEWGALSSDELKGALSLVYQQAPAASAVVLVGPSGDVRAGPVFVKEKFSEKDLPALLSAVPLSSLIVGGKGQVALSPAFVHAGSTTSSLAAAVKLTDGAGSHFLLAELSLAPVNAALKAAQ